MNAKTEHKIMLPTAVGATVCFDLLRGLLCIFHWKSNCPPSSSGCFAFSAINIANVDWCGLQATHKDKVTIANDWQSSLRSSWCWPRRNWRRYASGQRWRARRCCDDDERFDDDRIGRSASFVFLAVFQDRLYAKFSRPRGTCSLVLMTLSMCVSGRYGRRRDVVDITNELTVEDDLRRERSRHDVIKFVVDSWTGADGPRRCHRICRNDRCAAAAAAAAEDDEQSHEDMERITKVRMNDSVNATRRPPVAVNVAQKFSTTRKPINRHTEESERQLY